jgi:Domain of Unknown Function (DUF748)
MKLIRRHPWLFGILGGVVVLGIAVRVALQPLVHHFTQKALDSIPEYDGTFREAHLRLWGLAYHISDVKLIKKPTPGRRPLLYASEVDVRLLWGELLHFRLSGAAQIDRAKVILVIEQSSGDSAPKDKNADPSDEALDVGAKLRALLPLRIERIELTHCEVLLIDHTETGVPARSTELWAHDIEAALENIGTRRDLIKGQPSVLSLRAELQRSGKLSVFITADPLADKLNFSGQASLRELRLAELFGFMSSKTGIQAPEGTIDVFISFTCKNGTIDGAIKPELKNVHVTAKDADLGNQIKARVAQAALDLTSDRVPGREATVAIIPLKGQITDPKAEIWPTIISMLRNAYVSGITSGFDHLPLATSPKPQGPLQQAKEGLSTESFPKAQPR